MRGRAARPPWGDATAKDAHTTPFVCCVTRAQCRRLSVTILVPFSPALGGCSHWFFKADLFVDGEKMPENLMDIVKSTLTANKGNSVIGFKDNSSAIRGGPVTPMLPKTPGTPSALEPQASAGARAVLREEQGRGTHWPINSFWVDHSGLVSA